MSGEKKIWHFWEVGSINYQSIKSNTHAEGTFYVVFQKEAIFAGADTLME